ncbi:hypothetical protein B0H17DRAFT_1204702 [Mycena rosella]|uniref:Uncharacterized protein n=1 Tax=Mycena rosella TaxID=1033263 RepID=A0AAD7D8P9_MYCRO|nr:hypothetical protein B0H17DRAFT_1204702 [Mycena rosella]
MTEYTSSPAAIDQYMRTQSRIQKWTSAAARSQLCDPETPATPAVASKLLTRTTPHYNNVPLPYLATDTQAAWEHKKHDAMRKMQASGTQVPPALSVRTPPAPPNQVYNYTQQTTPYGSQVNISSQTSNGVYVQQHSYQQTTRALAPQTLQVPPVNSAPLAQNPYPAAEHFRLQGPESVPALRVRSKSSHGSRAAPSGGSIYAPPVPALPDRPRAHSSVRPPGAAAPLQPSNGAYANGVYGAPPRSVQSSISSLQLPSAYSTLGPSAQYPLPPRETRKSKSSATLKSKYAQQAQRPRVEDMPPMPAPQHAQMGFYTVPRGSKSSATLYAAPRTSRRHRDASMPEFGEKMSAPHPAASQMLVHSLIPLATYQEHAPAPRAKPQPLLKRIFGRKNT